MTSAGSVTIPASIRVSMFLRLLAIQGAWNFETMVGNGIGFCVEPALRLLPGGIRGDAYREALARQSQYFNAHPYLASIAVGALARAELDHVAPAKIERFRTALCGPLGSVGDRLVWASWLPASSLAALAAFGAGMGAIACLVLFLVLYNSGHFALRYWGLRAGIANGLDIASSLGHPVLRRGPQHIGRAGALLAGVAIPIAVARIVGGGRTQIAIVLVAAVAGAVILALLHGRVAGWKLALAAMVAYALFTLIL
jgi:PTS system mannose-specific IID component